MSHPHVLVDGNPFGDQRIGTLRPGERPFWLELPMSDQCIARLRQCAAADGLRVGTRVSLSLEARLVERELRGLGAPSLNELGAQAVAESDRHALAPTPELRSWVATLRDPAITGTVIAPDELPSLALPTRLLARIPPLARFSEVLEAADADSDAVELAVTCDIAAALAGRTLESWAYMTALRHGT
jgi:hypothetical protein